MRSTALVMTALFGLWGCGEEREIRRYCKLPEKCGCMEPQDRDQCEYSQFQGLVNGKQQAADAGLRFDEDCYLGLLDEVVDTLGCRSANEVLELQEKLLYCRSCDVVTGDKQEGAECTMISYGSDCAPGLACFSGICLDLCNPRPVGESCVREQMNGFSFTYACDGGYCDFNAKTCVALRMDGQSCGSSIECKSEYCFNSVCRAPPKVGDTCSSDSDCGDVLACAEGTCADPPGEGQPCTSRCAPGNTCTSVEEGTVCVADFPWVCPGG